MKKLTVEVATREKAGQGASRAIRRNNLIPAVIYGLKKESSIITVDFKGFAKLLEIPKLKTTLFLLNNGGKEEKVLLKDIQYHTISKQPIHLDFLRIDEAKPIAINISVNITGQEDSMAIKKGANLTIISREVPVIGLIKDMVEEVTFDITNLNTGDSIHTQDLQLPDGLSLQPNTENITVLSLTTIEDDAEQETATNTSEEITETSESSDETTKE
ncbi:MAG: 50S ribosomal protein L25/general stress protein Ctc [Alphaproteobacteria bacterium]|nr:50S ribosomal protein L25/general stress protein Ctc [Alphaproteobacteria bacterium]MBL0717722.1 50S ribosomal protein L25/general stress protein Ctc [Alphaproteobacteria bacterium]